jgi:hypothetical protein
MSDTTKPDLPEPPLVGEVTPPRSIGGRQYRSASCHGNGTLITKQEAFCQGVVFGGLSNADAYRGAYNASKMRPSTIWVKAAEVAANGKVAVRIGELAREMAAVNLHDAAAMRDRVLKGLLREAEHAETASARVQAWVALGKMFDIAPPPRLVADPKSLRIELEKKLRAYFGMDKPTADNG